MAERAPFGTGGFTTMRVFHAPRERVWLEWTEPERFADWFGGLECEIPLSTVSLDVRPGGAWRATMFCGPVKSTSSSGHRLVKSERPRNVSRPGICGSSGADRQPVAITRNCAEYRSPGRCRPPNGRSPRRRSPR